MRNLSCPSRKTPTWEAAKAEMNRTARSAAAERLSKAKSGVMAFWKAEENREGGDLERRAERSFSLRLCVAFEAMDSSRVFAILRIN